MGLVRQMPRLGQRAGVVVRERIARELGDEALVVPDLEMVVLAEHVHFARHARRFPQSRMNQHAALVVEFPGLAVVVHAAEEAEAGGMGGGDLGQLALDLDPHGHRVDADRVAGQARGEDSVAVLGLDDGPKRVGNLEPALVVNPGRRVPPKDSGLLHFAPPKTTRILDVAGAHVNGKILISQQVSRSGGVE